MHRVLKNAIKNINKHGSSLFNIGADSEAPQFTYSVGINEKQGKPDVIILGLEPDVASFMANAYRDRLLAGEVFEPNKFYSNFLGGFDVCFVKVDKKHYEEYPKIACKLNKGKFDYLQIVWPTTNNLWPWNSGRSDFYRLSQPILNDDGVLDKITTKVSFLS